MSNNAQKTPFARTLNRFAEKKVLDAIQVQGKSLPASVVAVSNSIVTVKFELAAAPFTLPKITIPIAGAEYVRFPTQVGDTGVVVAADARLGGVSGLGGGTADLSLPANLTALFFVPLGSTKFSPTDDPNAVVVYGPNGVVIRDAGKNCSIVVNPTDVDVVGKTTIKLTVGAASITITDGKIDLEGELTINGKKYLLHEHSGVTAGAANSGAVVP